MLKMEYSKGLLIQAYIPNGRAFCHYSYKWFGDVYFYLTLNQMHYSTSGDTGVHIRK